jgi:O-antigen ligase
MLKLPIPGIGNDPQVSIRSDFWFSAAQMFAHHFGFGVGPDNYGNFYEKYRSLHSIKTTELVLAKMHTLQCCRASHRLESLQLYRCSY